MEVNAIGLSILLATPTPPYPPTDEGGQMLLRFALDFMLSARRNARAAERFFRKAMNASHNQEPRVINVDTVDKGEQADAPVPPALKLRRSQPDPNNLTDDKGVGAPDPNVLKNAAYRPAIEELKADQTLTKTTELRLVKYLNNIVEQDHRFIKRLVNPGMGFGSFNAARRTLRSYEAMNMIRKGQIQGVEKDDILGQVEYARSNFWSCCIGSDD